MRFLNLLYAAASPLLLNFVAAGQSGAQAQPERGNDFAAKSLTEAGGFRLRVPIARAFPLFTPVGEKLWSPGWNPRILHPVREDIADGMVFTLDEPHGRVYWVVTQYDPANHAVAYVNVAPENVVNRILVRCREAGANETDVAVTYEHTALGESGNRWIATLTPEKYEAKMGHWKHAIEYGLEHGRPMPLGH